MAISCMFCEKFSTRSTSPKGLKDPNLCHAEVTANSPACDKKVIKGTFICPFTHKYQHINCCIRRVEKKNNRSRECNKNCPVYQQRETILFWVNPPKMVKLEKKR